MNHILITTVIRACQLVFTIISLGLSAKIVDSFSGASSNEANLVVATSVLTLIYLAAIYIVPRYYSLSSGIAASVEFVWFVLWLASFGCMANIYGSGCFYRRGVFKTVCDCGRALIAFTLFQWLLFLGSMGLLIWFSVVPVSKQSSFESAFSTNYPLSHGAIFLTDTPQNKEFEGNVPDLENDPTPEIQDPSVPVDNAPSEQTKQAE
jgi:hypothetical protein